MFSARNAFMTRPSGVVVPVAFDALGTVQTGNPGHGSSSVWNNSHVISATSPAVLVFFSLWSTSNPSSVTAKIGSTAMTALVSHGNWTTLSALPVGYWVFGLQGGTVPTSTQTIAVTTVGGGATQDASAISVSYKNTSGFGTAVWNGATSAATAMTTGATSGATLNDMIAAGFSPPSTSTSTLSVNSITSRKNVAWSTGLNFAHLVGDQNGATATATATDSSSLPYGAAAVPILH